MAGPWEKYQAQPPASGLPEITVTKHDAPAKGPWERYAGRTAPSAGEDIAKSLGSGLVRGAVETVMAPATLANLLEAGVNWAFDQGENLVRGAVGASAISPDEQARRDALRQRMSPVSNAIEAGQSAVRGVMDANLHAPQTTAGEYARTIGEFAPAALSPGSAVRRAASVLVPAMASETGGQLTKGTGWETTARVAGALAGGLGTALAGRSTPEQLVRASVSRMDENTVLTDWRAAQQLMDDAAAQGVRLTPAEALNQVSGGRYGGLADAQRIAENTGGGRSIMDEFMAARPGQVQAAGQRAMDNLSPRTMNPVDVGARTQAAAMGAIDSLRADINAGTRGAYEASALDALPSDMFDQIAANPAFQASLRRLRSDEVLGPRYAQMPDNSVGVIDAVTKDMTAAAESARNSASAGFNPERGMVFSTGAENARAAATQASPAYAQALAEQAARRQGELVPLEAGPMGQIAATPSVTSQRNALFPKNPEAGIAPVIGDTVKQLAARDPEAARALVRQHVETVFNDTTKALQSGPNQFGGAKFVTTLRSNPEVRASLQSAVEALPDGVIRWQGFNRFLDMVEATGYRRQTGSATAFNVENMDAMKGSGALGTIGKAASAPTEIPRMVREAFDRYRFGRNTEGLARILTSPASPQLFAILLKSAPNTVVYRNATAVLAAIGQQAGMAATTPTNPGR